MMDRRRKPLRIALVGWGAINRHVVRLLSRSAVAEAVSLVAIGVRSPERAQDVPHGTSLVTDPEQLAGLDLDIVAEAAGQPAVALWGESALRQAGMFAVTSAGALADAALLERLISVAEAAGSQLVVTSGALAGIDALAAASALPLDEVVHAIVKPPAAWRGTPAEALVALDALTAPASFFTGSAREAARRFPQNANVAVISALAGIGLDRTRVELIADPGITANCHRLSARGAFGRLSVTIENRALADNPKSSEMAALSLVRMISNSVSPLCR